MERFNQQLHGDKRAKEQTLAKTLAVESAGKYAAQQIEGKIAQMDLVTADAGLLPGSVRVASGEKPQEGTEWAQYGVSKSGYSCGVALILEC